MDVFETKFDPDTGEETTTKLPKFSTKNQVELGVQTEKANKKKDLYNTGFGGKKQGPYAAEYQDLLNKVTYDKGSMSEEEFNEATKRMDFIRQGNYPGGKPQTKVTYTNKEGEFREGLTTPSTEGIGYADRKVGYDQDTVTIDPEGTLQEEMMKKTRQNIGRK